MKDLERRVLSGNVELRAGKDSGSVLVGYAAVFNSLSEDLGGFREKVMPGAFADSLAAGEDVVARVNHNSDMLLGRTSNGTLRLKEDAHGLHYEVDLPDTAAARDLTVLVKRGDIFQSSFAFLVEPEDQRWSETEDGILLRELLKVGLRDVSPVVTPAYSATQVSARALEHAKAPLPGLYPDVAAAIRTRAA